MDTHIRQDHKALLDNLLHGKLPRNLTWSDVVDLVGQIGKVQPHGIDEYAFSVGTQRAFFKKPHTHNLDVDEVSRLRTFLKGARLNEDVAKASASGLVVVVIDHHAAHVYHDLSGTEPKEEEVTIKPYDPFHFHHHLIHRKEAHYRGERVPEENEFYEEIAKDLVSAEQIVLIGHGTGTSSAVHVLSDYLKKHHSAVFQRVIATENADLSALTEPQIEELAKKHLVNA